jgi:hypothetical protein
LQGCGTSKENPVCDSVLVSASFTTVFEVDNGEASFPKLKPVVTTADVHDFVVPGTLSDAVVTLVSPNLKPCMLDEEAVSTSFNGTPALSIPKLNLTVECDSEPGLALSHATHFNNSSLFCTMQSGQFHVPDGFLNLSPNKTSVVDIEDDVGVDLVAKTGLLVSQA